jgi:plastocyanin
MSSLRNRLGIPGIVAALAAFAIAPSSLCAQGTVTGRVTMMESGKSRRDIGTTIVWLAPTSRVETRWDTIPKHAIIAMRTREFLPHVQIVAAGGSVEFPNKDPFSHNVFSNSALGRFDLGLYRRRDTRSTTVNKAGVYAVYCNIHARMASFIIAVPSRHVATVDKNGEYVLPAVPTGEYELHAWHERAQEAETRIRVGPTGVTTAITLDARGFVPGPHLNKFGQPYAATRADRY